LAYSEVLKINSGSCGQTEDAGRLFAKILDCGDVVLLGGELGAGKTTFVSGIARGLGYNENTGSPSFTIINIYSRSKSMLVHADFYRLDGIEDILNTGIEDYIYSKNAITCIEWGDKIKDFLKKDYAEICFDYELSDKNTRIINIKSRSPLWDRKINKLRKHIKNVHFRY